MFEIVSRNGKNLIKTGATLIISNLAHDALRINAKDTFEVMLQDFRKISSNIKDPSN